MERRVHQLRLPPLLHPESEEVQHGTDADPLRPPHLSLGTLMLQGKRRREGSNTGGFCAFGEPPIVSAPQGVAMSVSARPGSLHPQSLPAPLSVLCTLAGEQDLRPK